MKKSEHKGTRMLDQCGRCSRGWIERVWVAKDVVAQEFHMLTELAFGIESASGIVEIDMPLFVQAAVLSGTQFVQQGCFLKGCVVLPECLFRYLHRC